MPMQTNLIILLKSAGPGMLAVNPMLNNEHKSTSMQVLQGGYDNTVIGAYPAKIVNKYLPTRVRLKPGRYLAEI